MEQNQNRSWLQIPRMEPPGTERPAVTPMQQTTETNEEQCIDMVLAMAYIKRQRWGELYDAEAGLGRGTMFPALDLPFVGEGACPRGE